MQDDWRLGLRAADDDGLKLLQIIEVVRGDGIPALHGLPEHLLGVHHTDLFIRSLHLASPLS
jgi:hypothetical protein